MAGDDHRLSSTYRTPGEKWLPLGFVLLLVIPAFAPQAAGQDARSVIQEPRVIIKDLDFVLVVPVINPTSRTWVSVRVFGNLNDDLDYVLSGPTTLKGGAEAFYLQPLGDMGTRVRSIEVALVYRVEGETKSQVLTRRFDLTGSEPALDTSSPDGQASPPGSVLAVEQIAIGLLVVAVIALGGFGLYTRLHRPPGPKRGSRYARRSRLLNKRFSYYA